MARTVPNTRIFKITAERMNGKHVESSDHAVHYIERDTDYVSEIRNSYPHGVDLVLDGLHESNFHRDFNLLSPMGKYVLFGNRTTNGGLFDTAKSVSRIKYNYFCYLAYRCLKIKIFYFQFYLQWLGQEKVTPLKLYEENKSVCGFNLRNLLYFQKDRRYIRETFDKVCQMWQDGEIQAVFDCILQFDDVIQKHKSKSINPVYIFVLYKLI
jgi:NADPH:quinone reductase-like Zn-dependent oxidoreductase